MEVVEVVGAALEAVEAEPLKWVEVQEPKKPERRSFDRVTWHGYSAYFARRLLSFVVTHFDPVEVVEAEHYREPEAEPFVADLVTVVVVVHAAFEAFEGVEVVEEFLALVPMLDVGHLL